MSPVSDLSGLQVLLVNTHVPRNTRELVSAVRNKYSQLPKVSYIMESFYLFLTKYKCVYDLNGNKWQILF